MPIDFDAWEDVPPSDEERRRAANKKPAFLAWNDTPEELPAGLLAAQGQGGAVLSAGEVCLLSGAGGVGKSMLTGSIALGFAMAGESRMGPG